MRTPREFMLRAAAGCARRVQAAAAEQARYNAQQLATAAGVEVSPDALEEAALAATAYGRERRVTLVRQLADREEKLKSAEHDEDKWREQLRIAGGCAQHVPVFPVSDILLPRSTERAILGLLHTPCGLMRAGLSAGLTPRAPPSRWATVCSSPSGHR